MFQLSHKIYLQLGMETEKNFIKIQKEFFFAGFAKLKFFSVLSVFWTKNALRITFGSCENISALVIAQLNCMSSKLRLLERLFGR